MVRSSLTRRIAALAAAVAVGAALGGTGVAATRPVPVASVPVPLTGPGSGQCVPMAALPCPALPVGQWYVLTVGRSAAVPVSACDATGAWVPADLTLTAMSRRGENVSSFATWCVPASDPTRAGSGLPWSELFDTVARQAN